MCSAVYGTVHYEEPLKLFENRAGHIFLTSDFRLFRGNVLPLPNHVTSLLRPIRRLFTFYLFIKYIYTGCVFYVLANMLFFKYTCVCCTFNYGTIAYSSKKCNYGNIKAKTHQQKFALVLSNTLTLQKKCCHYQNISAQRGRRARRATRTFSKLLHFSRMFSRVGPQSDLGTEKTPNFPLVFASMCRQSGEFGICYRVTRRRHIPFYVRFRVGVV